MTLPEQVRTAGVVGAGGAGFPTHVKLARPVEIVIANGAECEPLLHKDAALMEHFAAELVEGLRLVQSAVGAKGGVIGIKAKNEAASRAVGRACEGTDFEVRLLGDYYPAGDEFDLVHEVTGRLIPPGGFPPDVGCVVNNIESLVNVAAAARQQPVIRKTLTIAGAVARPVTLTVPLGTPLRLCLEAAGGALAPRPVFFLGGLMMGEMTEDLDSPVLKTTAGVVVLPQDHTVARRKRVPQAARSAIGRSACDQCRYCTEYCPRYLLGYSVEPHQVMRGLGMTAARATGWNEWAALCCACGLCTLFACPEDLFPKEACDDARALWRQTGRPPPGPAPVRPHPLRDGRRVPIRGLMKRLHVLAYDVPAPWIAPRFEALTVVLPLKQHAGEAAVPTVRPGEKVAEGQVIGVPPEGRLGARLHASVTGRVTAVEAGRILLERAS